MSFDRRLGDGFSTSDVAKPILATVYSLKNSLIKALVAIPLFEAE